MVAARFQAQAQAVGDVVALGEHAAEIEVRHRQFIAVITGLEPGRAGRAQRGVERVAQAVGEGVDAVIQARVVVPLAPLALRTGHGLHVAVLALGDRAVAVRVDLRPVGVAVRVAEVVRAFAVALVEGGEAVERGGFAERQLCVVPGVQILGLAIAKLVVALALQGQVGRGLVPRRDLVEAGAVGALVVLQFQADAQEAALVAQHGADLGAGVAGLAIGDGAVDRLEVGVVGAEAGFERAAFGRVIQDHVDHAGHRIGAVQRTGAIAQHLDALDRADRDRVEVDRGGALADLAVGVDQRAAVAALAVDQHQHLIGREAAQLGRPDVVGAAGVGLAREIERGQQRLQRAAQLAIDHAGLADVLGGKHVHRRGGFQHGPVDGAGAGDDHGVQRFGGVRRVLRKYVLGQQGGGEDERDGKAKARRGRTGHADSSRTTRGRGGGGRNGTCRPTVGATNPSG